MSWKWCIKSTVVIFSTYLIVLAACEGARECSRPDVTYRDFHISSSHNKTGIWKTTLGKIKVVVEHSGYPLTRSMVSGHWEVNVKISSTACTSSRTEETGKTSEESSIGYTATGLEEISFTSNTNNMMISGAFEKEMASAEANELEDDDYNDENEHNIFQSQHRFSGEVGEMNSIARSATDDYKFNEGKQSTTTEKSVSDKRNDMTRPEKFRKLELSPEIIRKHMRRKFKPWSSNSYMTDFVSYGQAGMLKLFSESVSWDEAKEKCETEGARLATVDTQEKVAALLDLFSKYPRVAKRSVLKNQVYVGINDKDQEGVFTTATGEMFTPWNMSVWFTNEPDNQNGDEDCVTFHTAGRIRDVPCSFRLPFFCERDNQIDP